MRRTSMLVAFPKCLTEYAKEIENMVRNWELYDKNLFADDPDRDIMLEMYFGESVPFAGEELEDEEGYGNVAHIDEQVYDLFLKKYEGRNWVESSNSRLLVFVSFDGSRVSQSYIGKNYYACMLTPP